MKGNDVLLYADPESVVIEVIDRLLVTQVTARPLTAAEIREQGLVFDSSSFQAYNFTAAFAAADGELINIAFPVILPTIAPVGDPNVSTAGLTSIKPPSLKSLQTLIPDTLEIQAQVPNLSVTGFLLTYQPQEGQNLIVPPIPGVVVIPGDIGFLNQVFSVLLMVGNVAPDGSNLVVSDALAEIVLPPGNDQVVFTPDDPLRMGRTAFGETPRVRAITQAGPDGKLGTADDIGTIGPGESGNAEFLVEGIREGSHVVEMEITATLNGLPVGPVPIRGRAAGAVLVRNPSFTLTFTHPETVNAGEPYTLDVTVTNTSPSPANFVSLNLHSRNLVGATLAGEPTQSIETILPGDSETLTFDLVALVSGRVTAATLDSDGKVEGRFDLKAAVGELGIPLSPDSLILPKEANALPPDLRKAALGLLGRAYAVATAPPAALPPDVTRFTRKIVWDRAVEVAEAGLRVTLHEPIPDSAAHLWMDFAGSGYPRLHERVAKETNLPFEQADYYGFDELRRRSFRGDVFADAVGVLLAEPLAQLGAAAFHQQLAEKMAYRPDHVSVLLAGGGGPLSATLSLRDAAGRLLGGPTDAGRMPKEIPFGDIAPVRNQQGQIVAYLALIAVPEPGGLTIGLHRLPGDSSPLTLSVVTPDGSGYLRQVAFENLVNQAPVASFPGHPYPFGVELFAGGAPVSGPSLSPTRNAAIADHAPSLLGVVQQKDGDILTCQDDDKRPSILGRPGRVIAVLFSEEVTKESVQHGLAAGDITHFVPEGNQVVSVALQPGRRIAFLALRDPVGPFVPRTITISGVQDRRGQPMPPQVRQIESTVDEPGGVVSGRVLEADGSPVPFANVRLLYQYVCEGVVTTYGISSKSTDEEGRYSWDYVLQNPLAVKIAALDPRVDQPRSVSFKVQRHGQRMNVDLVFLGRGSIRGRTLGPDGVTPLAGTVVRARSLTDSSQYGAITDELGRFTLLDVPVGTLVLEAVNVQARVEGFVSEFIPFAGSSVTRDFILFPVGDGAVIQRATVGGHVLRADGVTAVPGIPVVLYYQTGSQAGLSCPFGESNPLECAVAVTETGSNGEFQFSNTYAGSHRIYAFDQAALQEGNAVTSVSADGTSSVTVLLSGGLATVRGVVLDASGEPVAGARVGGGFTIVTTNETGQFVLTDVPVGRREIVAVSDALRTTGTAIVDIPSAGADVQVTVVLTPIASISGRVTEISGVPVAGNRVYLFEKLRVPEGSPPKINVIAQTFTDAVGQYLFEKIKVPPRTAQYFVSAFRPDFSDGNVVPIALRYQDQLFRADIVFKGGGRGQVVGRVFDDADGTTPLPARVGISGEQPMIAGGLVGVGFQHVENFRIVDTNFTTGQFSFSGVWAGRFVLRAVGQFSPDPISAEGQMPDGGGTVELNLRLTPTGRITGTVLQPDGFTPAGAGVIVRYKSDAFKVVCTDNAVGDTTCTSIPQGVQNEQVVTDGEGRYLLPLVNAGPFTITVEDPATGRVGRVKGEMKPGQNPEIPIRLLGLGNLTVQVLGSDAVTPIPDAEVVVKQIGFPDREVTVRANAEGVVQLTGGNAFSEGELTVLATDLRNGFAGRATGRIVHDGEDVTVRVFLYDAWGTVTGTVLAPDGLTPVPNAEVVLSNTVGPLAFAVTAGDGSYSIEQIPLGAFTLDAFEAATARRGFASGQVDFNQQIVPVNIVQLGIGLVKGHALRAGDLEPLVNWQVSLSQISPTGRQLETLTTTTGLNGEYSFPGVSVGSVRATATHPDPLDPTSGSSAATLARDGQVIDLPVIVTISRPLFGRIQGVVLNPDLTPEPHAMVELRVGLQTLFATAGPDGAFGIEQVPLGRFTLLARSQTSLNVGGALGEIQFENEVEVVNVVLVGLSQVSGTVEHAGGGVAANVSVSLDGDPASGCFEVCAPGEDGCPTDGRKPVACSAFTDGNGRFLFTNVPARTFSIIARSQGSSLTGMAGGRLTPGQSVDVRVVLEPGALVTGRVLLANGSPAAGAAVEIILPPLVQGGDPRGFYGRAGADGAFRLEVPLAAYTLTATDPLGTGVARRFGTFTGNVDLGDITLDEAAPSVVALLPVSGAVQVPRDATIRLTFSEPIQPGTVTPETVVVSSPSGPVTGVLRVTDNDTVVTFTPVALLNDQTRYAITVSGVEDRVGTKMSSSFSASFTTMDITPPTAVDITPIPASNGVTIYTTVRVRYSEPIDPSKYRGPPIQLSTIEGPVDGRTDYLFGNTVVVFSPSRPLLEDRTYSVVLEQAFDLSGLAELQPAQFSFSTTDRTPPELAGLIVSNDGKVITNSFVTITADVGTSHDVALVDYFVNGTFVTTIRQAPFALALQAVPALGAPGDLITVQAFGVDTSGNRSTTAVQANILILEDAAPGVVIEGPAHGATFKNGDRVDITVRATDDLGIVRLGYRAATGLPQDAEIKTYAQPATTQLEAFSFTVPADAAPGATILIEATAVDTKGEQTAAAPITIVVLDSVRPNVSITGVSTGERVLPGQQATAVVSADDLGGIASITFTASGVVNHTETRTIDPARSPVLASFSFTVPPTAQPGDSVRLDATATDPSGNVGTAAQVILPVADTVAPTVILRTETGSLELAPGQTITVFADAEDEIAVARVELQGSGAFALSDAKQVSPPTGSASVPFTISAPVSATPGALLLLTARAFDTSNNASAPATLTLTIRAVSGVTMPASALLLAGETQQIEIEVSGGAPAEGLRVDLSSSDPDIAEVPLSVTFVSGETTRTFGLTGVSGGTATITASVQGAPQASLIATVRGGIVTGTVDDPASQQVAAAQITVTSTASGGATLTFSVLTDSNGRYFVEGAIHPSITVRVLDPSTGLRGFAVASLNGPNGFAVVDVALVPAGAISGTVRHPDEEGSVSAGARVDLFDLTDDSEPVASVFTDENGEFEFALVPIGKYRLHASDQFGNRGRSLATLSGSGQSLTVPITYLGVGSVTGVVLDGAGQRVANAELRFSSSTIFGEAPALLTNADQDGAFRIDGVLAGRFTVTASDAATNQAGSAAGEVRFHGEVVPVEITLSNWGALTGIVYRQDATTPVAGAVVTAHGVSTTTDVEGRYTLTLLPLGAYTLAVSEASTRGLGHAIGSLVSHAVTETVDVVLFGQGSLLVTVVDALAQPVADAVLTIDTTNGVVSDRLAGRTGADGTALVQRVLAGTFSVTAKANDLEGATAGTLQADDVLPVLVTLEPTASIAGTVYQPDGQNPVSSGVVMRQGQPYPIGADGTYRIEHLRLGAHDLEVYDAQGRLRARIKGVELTTGGETRQVDITSIALATVTGRVITPEGGSASSLLVTLVSEQTVLPGQFTAITNAAGFYEILNVPAGPFSVATADPARGLLGEGAGTVSMEGETVNVDVLLVANAITLPAVRHDANNFVYRLEPAGGVTRSLFDASRLEIIVDGQTTVFAGSTLGTVESGGREVAVRQQNAGGLSITRKTFVPLAGYFARQIEILANPTSEPIVADVRVSASVQPLGGALPDILTTSSGDEVLEPASGQNPDRWVVIDDATDADPLVTSNHPALGFVFDGSGAGVGTVLAEFSRSSTSDLTVAWRIVIPAGGTVALMHFHAPQVSRAGALAAVERLVQLPPEALAGLSAQEIAWVQNFAVPSGGSALAPLPALTGRIVGRVLAGDGVTTVASAPVGFTSSLSFFGRARTVTSGQNGAFDLSGTLVDGASRPIPIAPFGLKATHPATGVASPDTVRSFAPGTGLAEEDVVFEGTGGVTGILRRHSGALLALHPIEIVSTAATVVQIAGVTGADGRFLFTGLPPAEYAVIASVAHPQGPPLIGRAHSVVDAGATITLDVSIEPTGGLTGVLRTPDAQPVANTPVELTGSGRTYTTQTNGAGQFAFVDAPVGTFVLRAQSPGFYPAEAEVTLLQDQTVTRDLALASDTSPPSVIILTPSAPGPVTPGSSLSVTVRASDDIGVSRIDLSLTGVHVATDFVEISPEAPSVDRTFVVGVPADTDPGELTITVTARDAAGNTSTPAVLVMTVLDVTGPSVSIAAPAAGAVVDPRAALSVTVSASDAGGVVEIALTASGITSFTATRPIAPSAQSRTEEFEVTFDALPITGGSMTLSATARDAAGNIGTAAPVVVQVLDVVPPEVVSIEPADGAIGVDPATPVSIRFSEAVDRTTVTASSVRLMVGSSPVTTVVEFSEADRRVILTPAEPLPMNTFTTVEVGTQVTDVAGNALPAPVTSQFRTESPDTISPQVISIQPGHSAVNVPVSTTILVGFSEPIAPESVTGTSFRVSIDGASVAGVLTFEASDALVRFTPDDPLPFGSVIVTELSSGITDRFGNPLVDADGAPLSQPLTFTFLTGEFGIASPRAGDRVLEHTRLRLEARAASGLGVATVVFAVNDINLPPVAGPDFATTFDVLAATATPVLRIVAVARDEAGTELGGDEITVEVVAGISIRPRLVGVPLNGTGRLQLSMSSAADSDVQVTLVAIDPTIVAVPEEPVVIPAGQTVAYVTLQGLSEGSTTVIASSSRGVADAIVSVSAPVSGWETPVEGGAVGTAIRPAPSVGTVFVPVTTQRTVTVRLLQAPASATTPVTVTTSNASVVSIAGDVVIQQGSEVAMLALETGLAGEATLTFRFGAHVVELKVVVGQPTTGNVPPTVAKLVSVSLAQVRSAGQAFVAVDAAATVEVLILSAPAAEATQVQVTSSNPSIANVTEPVTIQSGSQVATLQLVTGAAGTAVLTLRAGALVVEFTVIVGPPPPGTVPPILASPVGVSIRPLASIGMVVILSGAQQVVNVTLLAQPAATNTLVTVTTSDSLVAAVEEPVIIPAGSQVVTLSVITGIEGTAILTLQAGATAQTLTIIVGTPQPGQVPVIVAPPVGISVQPAIVVGHVISPVLSQSGLNVRLVTSPVTVDTPVTVTSSDPAVATVVGNPVIAAGTESATLIVSSGEQGVAVLTLRFGDQVRELLYIVGTPPAGTIPPIVAPLVRIEIQK